MTACCKNWRNTREYYFTPLLEDCDDEDFERQLRHFGSPRGIRDLLGPPTVTLHRQAEDGQAKFSFDCNCAWDEEHGVGVLMHKDKVVEVAGSSENYDL